MIIIWTKQIQRKLGGVSGHPIIPGTQVHLCRMIWAEQKDLNKTGKFILLFCGILTLIKITLLGRPKGTLVFDSFYSFHRHKVIRYLYGSTYCLLKVHVFWMFSYSLVIMMASSQRPNTKTGI